MSVQDTYKTTSPTDSIFCPSIKRLTPELTEKIAEQSLVRLDDIEKAQEILQGITVQTQVDHSRALGRKVGHPVYFKTENLQRAGSFKVRGAYVEMEKLTDEQKEKGVVAASAGNHAQGVALAAKKLGIKSRIYMPHGVALPKLVATQDHGAEVILHGDKVDEALAEAQRYADESGAQFIHPFDSPSVIAGQATVGLEIIDQVPDVDTVFVGIGGGGLAAGVALAVKAKAEELGHPIRVVGVQAENAAAYPVSLAAGQPTQIDKVNTMADGIAVGKPGETPFNIIDALVDDVVTVSENDIARMMVFLLERSKLVVEPAGAVAAAALEKYADLGQLPEDIGTSVAVLSGGNIDPMLMHKVIQRGLFVSGRFLTIGIMLKDMPGELTKVSGIISGSDANVTGVQYTRVGSSINVGDVVISIDMETKGSEHAERVLEQLRVEGYEPWIIET